MGLSSLPTWFLVIVALALIPLALVGLEILFKVIVIAICWIAYTFGPKGGKADH